MNKYILLALLVFVMIFFAFSVYSYMNYLNKNIDENLDGTLMSEKFNTDNPADSGPQGSNGDEKREAGSQGSANSSITEK